MPPPRRIASPAYPPPLRLRPHRASAPVVPVAPAAAARGAPGAREGDVEVTLRVFAHGGTAVVARRLAGEGPLRRTVAIDAIVR